MRGQQLQIKTIHMLKLRNKILELVLTTEFRIYFKFPCHIQKFIKTNAELGLCKVKDRLMVLENKALKRKLRQIIKQRY
jgi:hypothetical protein